MEGNRLRGVVLGVAVLALIAFSGIAAAQDLEEGYTLEKEEKKMTFAIDQHVSGVGFFSTYRYALMPDVTGTEGRLFNGVELENKAHGSGTINTESLFSGENSYTNTSHLFDTDDGEEIEVLERRNEIEVFEDYEEEATSVVDLKEDSIMTSDPTVMPVGTKYYAQHPITFKSLLNDDTWAKNRNGFNSLNHRIEGAHGLDMALDAQSDATNTTINVDENLVDGKVHFGALLLAGIPREEEATEETEEDAEEDALNPEPAMKAWHKPLVEVDADYIGTYHVRNNMTLTTSEDEKDFENLWLPCCFGGYLDMPTSYQKGTTGFGSNATSIFDCSCPKALNRA
jgi:predicted NUDIX family phosphoesterase